MSIEKEKEIDDVSAEMEEIDEEESGSSMDDDNEDEDDDDDGEGEGGDKPETKRQTYIPTVDTMNSNEELEYDESAYVMYHKAETGFPCLSFDIIRDNLGDEEERGKSYPQTSYLVGGTQATKVHINSLLVLKMSNLLPLKKKQDEDLSDSESEDENLDDKPELECFKIPHNGCINRVRSTIINNKAIAASWSELGNVHIWDLSKALQAVNDVQAMTYLINSKEKYAPLFTFTGHRHEGFAVDWSNAKQGLLATGDCVKNIFVWKPADDGFWHIDQQPLIGHTDSVEDIQWSPNEENVLASCSVDKSIRIWDIRARPGSNCMVTVSNAHDSDVNVISWNRNEKAFLISGGDDGVIKTWDLRQFKSKASNPKPIATFKHHLSYITSIEWNPTDGTVFAASGNDNQLTIWDLAVEKDQEKEDEEQNVANLPPQLLFIHQGQKEIKELHWHPQLTGVIISTAINGFDIFRTISV